jgi:D-glycero-beta-D-manno-heptose 1-phosphate adenylyltransferase
MKNLEVIASRVYSWEQIVKQRAVWRFQDKKIVFTNGCFDILHLGHIEYLAKSKDLGDVLIVGLNSDASIKGIKGPGRPINNEHARAISIAALSFIQAVVLFDQPTPYELIKIIQPDILVKGKDYTIDQIVGHDIVTACGGEVKTIELTEGFSTSGIIDKIRIS